MCERWQSMHTLIQWNRLRRHSSSSSRAVANNHRSDDVSSSDVNAPSNDTMGIQFSSPKPDEEGPPSSTSYRATTLDSGPCNSFYCLCHSKNIYDDDDDNVYTLHWKKSYYSVDVCAVLARLSAQVYMKTKLRKCNKYECKSPVTLISLPIIIAFNFDLSAILRRAENLLWLTVTLTCITRSLWFLVDKIFRSVFH